MVKQITQSDCCIAAVANACGKSHLDVKAKFGTLRGGMQDYEIAWLISCFWDRGCRKTCVRGLMTISRFIELYPRGRFVICIGGVCTSHAAVIDGKVFGASVESTWYIETYFTLFDK